MKNMARPDLHSGRQHMGDAARLAQCHICGCAILVSDMAGTHRGGRIVQRRAFHLVTKLGGVPFARHGVVGSRSPTLRRGDNVLRHGV